MNEDIGNCIGVTPEFECDAGNWCTPAEYAAEIDAKIDVATAIGQAIPPKLEATKVEMRDNVAAITKRSMDIAFVMIKSLGCSWMKDAVTRFEELMCDDVYYSFVQAAQIWTAIGAFGLLFTLANYKYWRWYKIEQNALAAGISMGGEAAQMAEEQKEQRREAGEEDPTVQFDLNLEPEPVSQNRRSSENVS